MSTPAPLSSKLTVASLGPALGAEVHGFDFDCIDAASFFALRQAFNQHLALRFRGYDIDDDHLVQLGRTFGALQVLPGFTRNDKIWDERHPEIFVISNIKENGRSIGELGDGELHWHTDLAFEPVPPAISFLRAVEVPPEGGDTVFANMYLAYERLPAALQRRVEPLRIKHQLTHTASGTARYGFEHMSADDVQALPGEVHPIVRTHPDTGRRSLYLGRRFGAYCVGLSPAESEALLDELWDAIPFDAISWHQQWQPGDMVAWDNRCTMHRRDSFSGTTRRLLHRVVTEGSRPF